MCMHQSGVETDALLTNRHLSRARLQTFPFNDWIDKAHGLEHVLNPDIDGDGKARV